MLKVKTSLCGGIFAIIAAAVVFALIPSQVHMTPKAYTQAINQQTMPILAASLMAIMGVCMIVRSLVLKKEKVVTIIIRDELHALLFFAGITAAILLMPYITYLGTAALVIIFCFVFMKKKGFKIYAGSFLFATLFYAAFKFLLGVPLP